MKSLPHEIVLGDVTFSCIGSEMVKNDPKNFGLRKSDWMADRYRELAAQADQPQIVELGVDQGASTVECPPWIEPG